MQQDTPPPTQNGSPVQSGGDKAGQALGWPICHEIMPKQQSLCHPVAVGGNPELSLTLSTSSQKPGDVVWAGTGWHVEPGTVPGQGHGRNPNVLGQHRGRDDGVEFTTLSILKIKPRQSGGSGTLSSWKWQL